MDPLTSETFHTLMERLARAWSEQDTEAALDCFTSDALYLGEDKAVRLPRIHWATGQIAKERTWLPRLAPHLPLELPIQLAAGTPAAGYPYPRADSVQAGHRSLSAPWPRQVRESCASPGWATSSRFHSRWSSASS